MKVGGVTRYHTVGYSTVYEYYAYGRDVNKKRPGVEASLENNLTPLVLDSPPHP